MSEIDTKKCYIIAACKDYSEEITFTPDEDDLIIAADGGYDILESLSIEPDILLGDFDSISHLPEIKTKFEYPKEKDETDTFLAYQIAFEKGYKNFIIFGGLGGRIDHTIANLQTLTHIAHSGGRGFLIGNNTIITAISDSKITFSPENHGVISVFSQMSSAEGVTLKGLKYNVENITLSCDFPLGVSNEFVGDRAEVAVKNGVILIVWSEKPETFLLNFKNYVK